MQALTFWLKKHMQECLLTKVAKLGALVEEVKNIYVLFIRSLLEQSSVVWHTSISSENRQDLERVQKTALKIICNDKYIGYKRSLAKVDLLTLEERRNILFEIFSITCAKNSKFQDIIQPSKKEHTMQILYTKNEN